MAKKELKVTCRQCNGSGWFIPERYGCFNCGGYKKAKGSGVDRYSALLLIEDEVFNKWVEKDEAVKEVAIFTGWTTDATRNFLNHTMHRRHHLLVCRNGKMMAKKHFVNTEEYKAEVEATKAEPEVTSETTEQ